MFKKFVGIGLLVLASFGVASCGSSNASSNASSNTTEPLASDNQTQEDPSTTGVEEEDPSLQVFSSPQMYVETTRVLLQPLYTKWNYKFALVANNLHWCDLRVVSLPAKQNLPDSLPDMLSAMSDVVAMTALATYYHAQCIAGNSYDKLVFSEQVNPVVNNMLSELVKDVLTLNAGLNAQCRVQSFAAINEADGGWRYLLSRIIDANNNANCRALMQESAFQQTPRLLLSQ